MSAPTLDKQLAFRLSGDDYAWLEREAERQRRTTGRLATASTVLRDLIAAARAAEQTPPSKPRRR